MQSTKLTKRAIDAFRHPGGGRAVLWDAEVPGLGIRAYPDSTTKTFVLSYRVAGRKRLMKLGRYGAMTLHQARKEAQDALALVRQREDPMEERRRSGVDKTFGALWDRYLEHAKVHKRPRSIRSDETIFRLHILPRLGSMKVHAIDEEDISQLHHAMRDRPGAANRTIALLSKMFNLAEKNWKLRPGGTNPCRTVKKYKERKIKRFLSNDELASERIFQGRSLCPSITMAAR